MNWHQKSIYTIQLNVVHQRVGLHGLTVVKDESRNIHDSLMKTLPQMSCDSTIFHPTWVRKDGILYQANNTYLVTDLDGLDPIFSYLHEVLLVSSHVVVFVVSNCVTLHFDRHYHAYVIILTPKQLLITIDKLHDFQCLSCTQIK